MIRNIDDRETRRLASGVRSRKLPPEIQEKAMRLLRLMADCSTGTSFAILPETSCMPCAETVKDNMLPGSTGNGALRSLRSMESAPMSKSPITTTEEWSNDPADWLHNPHAGEMLWLEFMEPESTTAAELAGALEVAVDRIEAVIAGRSRMDADLDLRLGRYYGVSDGFFLRMQDSYELLQAKRDLMGKLDRIVPRAA